MVPVTYVVPGELTSPKFGLAFALGCGGTVAHPTILRAGDFAAFCTPPVWSLLRQAQAEGRGWYYGDHGYVGRGRYFRITRNAYQHDGRGDAAPDRFRAFGRRVQAWRTSGQHVLVCPNSETYFQLFGMTAAQWVRDTVAALQQVTDREIRVRWKTTAVPILSDLRDAWALVTFSSAAALDALIAGVPVFSLAPWSAAARMGRSSVAEIEAPAYPDDREPFLWNLAAQQFRLDEIASGYAWRVLHAA